MEIPNKDLCDFFEEIFCKEFAANVKSCRLSTHIIMLFESFWSSSDMRALGLRNMRNVELCQLAL